MAHADEIDKAAERELNPHAAPAQVTQWHMLAPSSRKPPTIFVKIADVDEEIAVALRCAMCGKECSTLRTTWIEKRRVENRKRIHDEQYLALTENGLTLPDRRCLENMS